MEDQSAPFRAPAHKLRKLFLLRRIVLQKETQGNELYFGQLPTLEYIAAHENCTQNEAAEALLVTPASMAQMTKRLESSGLLEKRIDRGNLRCKRLSVTEQGRMLSARCRAVHNDFDRRLFEGFSAAEIAQFDTMLGRMICNITGEEFPPEDSGCTAGQLEARLRALTAQKKEAEQA